MAASSTRPLNPAAPPFVPVASDSPKFCPPASSSLPLGFPIPPQCLLPPPSLPLPCGLSVPPLPWVQVPPPPCQVTVYCRPLSCPVTAYCIPPSLQPPLLSGKSCSVTETAEGASDKSLKAEVENRPSPRSVLSPRTRSPASVSPRAPKPRAAPRPMGSKPAFDPSSAKTSLMICNIPNGFSKRRIMAILDQHCAEENEKLRRSVGGRGKAVSEYDFLYVPIDFRTKFNKGYAFVNMTTATAARRLHEFLQGHSWAATGSKKVCEVVHASIQGADALVKHFSSSKFPCGNGNEEFLPVRFGPPRSDCRPTAERVIGHAVVRPARC